MTAANGHVVGLRELRHNTREVLARVEQGETLDVTDYGRLVARLVPIPDQLPPSALTRLVESGRARLAIRPGFRPPLLAGDGTDGLGAALDALRDEQSW
jgi:prevent-host-death family protein